MKLGKRKKPSHDIFNKMYTEEIFDAYERLVEKLLSSHIYFDILPKQYQRAYCEVPFGKAFSETSGKTFTETFSSAFNDKVHPVHDVHFDTKNYKLHEAFNMMHNYNLADSLTKELYKQKRLNRNTNITITDMLETLKSYDKPKNLKNEEDVGRTMVVNEARLYQSTLEYLHVLYTTNKYKILSENASSNMKATFRERNLAAKNRYIDMLEDTLRWRKMKQQEKFSVFLKRYYSQLEKLVKLNREAERLKKTVNCYIYDKKGRRRTKALTGLTTISYIQDWISRNMFYIIEINGIKEMAKQQIPLYIEEKRIEALKLNIKRLCNNIEAQIDETEIYSSDTKIKMHKQLNYLLNTEVEEYLEKLLWDFYRSTDSLHQNIATTMSLINMKMHAVIDNGIIKRKKEIQQQDQQIDQLEMKIIRHLIDTTTTRDIKNKECDNANSIYHNNVIKNYTNSDARSPKKKSKNSKEFQITNIHVTKNNAKIELQKHIPNAENLLKYAKASDKIVDDTIKIHLRENLNKDKRDQMEKASHQMILLLNNLKLDFICSDKNLNRAALKIKPSKDKCSESQANSVKRCDTCKLNSSNIIDCAKYITHALYEENLNRFYVLTTAMDQLSFLLHMMRTSIFRDGMSRRNQWSIKKMKKKMVMIRNQLREILGLKIVVESSLTKYTNVFDPANSYKTSLTKCTNVFGSANSYKTSLTKCTNVCGSANSYNSVFMDQSNNKDMLEDLNPPTSLYSTSKNKDKNDSSTS